MKRVTISIVAFTAVFVVVFGVFLIQQKTAAQELYRAFATLTKEADSQEIIFDLNPINTFIETTQQIANKKALLLLLPAQQRLLLEQLTPVLPDFSTLFVELTQGTQRWVILFQNSNELRATGGFMGSYAVVEIVDGKVITIDVEDIYDADGQFAGYVAPPKGVAEYLSGGKGLRLPDANWNPDTRKSAEQILPFFAFGNKHSINGIVFVNIEFAKDILNFLGPIELVDYNTVVTAENIDEVLRSRRADFFPGSIQKKHMLSQLLTQLRIKIVALETSELLALSNSIQINTQKHNLQFFSNNTIIDEVFSKYSMRQSLTSPQDSEYLYLVESNVGINKANKNVTREVTIAKNAGNRVVTVNFSNNNEVPTISKLTPLTAQIENPTATQTAIPNNHLSYVNYQRVIVPQDWKLTTAYLEENEITVLDVQTIENNGSEFTEIGFLIVIPESESKLLKLTFDTKQDFDTIYIQKQPGTPSTSYFLEYNQNQVQHDLEQNKLLMYP